MKRSEPFTLALMKSLHDDRVIVILHLSEHDIPITKEEHAFLSCFQDDPHLLLPIKSDRSSLLLDSLLSEETILDELEHFTDAEVPFSAEGA